jgi:hypothetical protein
MPSPEGDHVIQGEHNYSYLEDGSVFGPMINVCFMLHMWSVSLVVKQQGITWHNNHCIRAMGNDIACWEAYRRIAVSARNFRKVVEGTYIVDKSRSLFPSYIVRLGFSLVFCLVN